MQIIAIYHQSVIVESVMAKSIHGGQNHQNWLEKCLWATYWF